jgi:peptidoglycan/xylan/chitin deacetylase (PgdA/CDA1 family)
VGARSVSPIDLPVSLFEEQVASLAADGRIVSLDDGLASLAQAASDRDPVVLTFDDGTRDWVEEVLPVLARHRAPATFYVATDFVERQRRFPDDGEPITWGGLDDLVASGLATIGSHTDTHLLLDRVDGVTAGAELDRSVSLIGERLGVDCRHFAYPKALLGSPAAEAEVVHRFDSAAVAGSTTNPYGRTNPHRLARTPIQVQDGMRWFRRKAAGGMSLEERVRAAVAGRRYTGATT